MPPVFLLNWQNADEKGISPVYSIHVKTFAFPKPFDDCINRSIDFCESYTQLSFLFHYNKSNKVIILTSLISR